MDGHPTGSVQSPIIFFCHLQLYIYHGNNLDSFLFFTLDHQRIALVYFIVALIEAFTVNVRPTTVRSGPYAIFNAYRWQWYTILILPDSSITLWLQISFHFAFSWFWKWVTSLTLSENNRLGGFIAFVIYMVTTFSLYVPDWSFVYHNDGNVNDGKQFTVSATFLGIPYHHHWNVSSLIQFLLVRAGKMWCEGQPGASLQRSWLCW